MTEPTPVKQRTATLATTCAEIRGAVAQLRGAAKTIGFVPTMGALHAGHLSLVQASLSQCDATVVSIFVNPIQFGRQEDLHDYPRSLDVDLQALESYDVDVVFAPSEDELYPQGFSTFVQPPREATILEGRCRPGHFRGVTTVVLKLLNLVSADAAFFGQKDYQQSLVVRRMVEDLNLPVEIHVCPTVREEDGLAMSSRNAYLPDRAREQACALHRCLELATKMVAEGHRDAAMVVAQMRQTLGETGIRHVDYIALVDPESLEDVRQINGPVLAAVAAYVDKARLIDNCLIG